MGRTAPGKTTTIRILLDLIRPTSGRARVFGIETPAIRVAIHRRDRLPAGQFALYDRLTGGETIDYFANLRGSVDPPTRPTSSPASTSTRRAASGSTPRATSRRSGLVIALQHRPDLLILDEPTSGLDPLVQQAFFALPARDRREGRTAFLSSHILGEVEKTCDRVAIIRDGRIVKVDRVEALRDLAHHQVELQLRRRRSHRACSPRIPA